MSTRNTKPSGVASSRAPITRRPSRSKNSWLASGRGAVRLAFVGIGEDEIDIGGDVELAAAELAHADDDQLLGDPVEVAGLAVERGEGGVVDGDRRPDGGVGQHGHVFAHFGKAGATGEIARERVQHGAPAQGAQRRGERRAVERLRHLNPCRRRVERRVEGAQQPCPIFRMRRQHLRGVTAVRDSRGEVEGNDHRGFPSHGKERRRARRRERRGRWASATMERVTPLCLWSAPPSAPSAR